MFSKYVTRLGYVGLLFLAFLVLQLSLHGSDIKYSSSRQSLHQQQEDGMNLAQANKLIQNLEALIHKLDPDPTISTIKSNTAGKPPGLAGLRHEELSSSEGTKLQVKIWVDIPNDFPWRKCVLDYNGNAATSECILKKNLASSWLVSIFSSTFKIINQENKRCLEPKEGEEPRSVKVRKCTKGGWIYSVASQQLEWSEGGCLTSLGTQGGNGMTLTSCNTTAAEQRYEFGYLDEEAGKILPLDEEDWTNRQKQIRDPELQEAKEEAIRSIKAEYKPDYTEESQRRAVVFYLDKGSGFLAYLNWWILAWKLIGLNSAEEKFDLVLFTHPASLSLLPKECVPYSGPDLLQGEGKCIHVELLGVFYRDKRYDPYLNSHECLVSEKASFLSKYSHLLRSDLDTFPAPGLLGNFPKRVLANKYQGYTFRNASGVSKITEALKNATAYLGYEHKGWHDIGSSWYGPSEKILRLSKITVAMSRYLRLYLFGPGTHCRCASCTNLPADCQWGGGPYAGTLLLYAQEIAMNLVWTEEEFKSMDKGYLDYGTTSTESVCEKLNLHVFHNDEPFSKFRFTMGKYKDLDMKDLKLETARDYAMFIALKSAGQGVGEQALSEKYGLKADGDLAKICKITSESEEVKTVRR